MIYLNNFLFDFIQIWCIILSESYVVPSWSCVGLVILTKVSHLQFSRCDFLRPFQVLCKLKTWNGLKVMGNPWLWLLLYLLTYIEGSGSELNFKSLRNDQVCSVIFSIFYLILRLYIKPHQTFLSSEVILSYYRFHKHQFAHFLHRLAYDWRMA